MILLCHSMTRMEVVSLFLITDKFDVVTKERRKKRTEEVSEELHIDGVTGLSDNDSTTVISDIDDINF